MQLPLIGTIDLSPSGLFLVFAVLVAVGYLTWQIVEGRKKARAAAAQEASDSEPLAERANDADEGDGRQQGDGSRTP
jgi:uncharacterized protein YpmB